MPPSEQPKSVSDLENRINQEPIKQVPKWWNLLLIFLSVAISTIVTVVIKISGIAGERTGIPGLDLIAVFAVFVSIPINIFFNTIAALFIGLAISYTPLFKGISLKRKFLLITIVLILFTIMTSITF